MLGGFAGNAGIQDAHNLAWKMALVLKRQAPRSLLNTYHTERHPVGVFIVDQAYKRWLTRCYPSRSESSEEDDELPDFIVELGPRYNNSAGIMYINGAKGAVFEDPFWPTAFPGSRAPHAWLSGDDLQETKPTKSLFDHFETSKFVLICQSAAKVWLDEGDSLSEKYPLKVVGVAASDREFLAKFKIRETGAVLIRPDGIIGWKALNDSEIGQLEYVMKRLLCQATDDDIPQVSRAKTMPAVEITGSMDSMRLGEKNPPPPKSGGGGGLLRRMTTMRSKLKGSR
jgi:hypothetical protein